MKRTYMIFLALCLVGGILVWIMSRPKIVESPKSNEVIESPDLAQQIAEVEIVIPYDTIAKPKEVMPELEDQIEEPEKPKADTIVSPDGRYYMVFPIEDVKFSAGVYDSRTGKRYRTFEVQEELCYYEFVENQEYMYNCFGCDNNQGFLSVINFKDPSKDFYDEYCHSVRISRTGRYLAYDPGIWLWDDYHRSENGGLSDKKLIDPNTAPRRPDVIVFDTKIASTVLWGGVNLSAYANSGYDGMCVFDFISDSNDEYLLVSYENVSALAVYETNTWQLINTIPVSHSYNYSDGFDLELENGCIWDEETNKYYKLDPRR